MRIQIALLLITLMAAACSPAAPVTPTSTPAPPPTPTDTPVPKETDEITDNLVDHLEKTYGLEAGGIEIVEKQSAEWRDSCLGVGQPGEPCLQVLTSGYRIILDTPQGRFRFHTDRSGRNIRLASGPSGIEGQAVIGPQCPVQVKGTECPDQPYPTTITILDEQGGEVTRVQTDEKGQFHVPLPPGTYTLKPEAGNPLPTANEQTVTVKGGEFTRVGISYDSGIR
jgi:hypothetical protein